MLQDIGFLEVVESRAASMSPGKISYCEWIITSKCNFACPYCNRLEPRGVQDPGLDQIHEFCGILAAMDCRYVHLTGGEPTVRRDLVEIVRIIRDHGMRVGISTNGSRATDQYLGLVDAGVELFSISLDTHDRAQNPQFAGVKNVFDQVVENIRVLATKCYVSTGVVFNDHNINQYREILEFISALGVRDIRVGTDTRYNQVVRFDLPESLLSRHPILRFRVNNFNQGLNMRGSALATTGRCHLVRDDLTIFGRDYYPCAVYAREKGRPIGQFGPGNVQERADWFSQHDSHEDSICKKFCMDFKCRFNDRVEHYEKENKNEKPV